MKTLLNTKKRLIFILFFIFGIMLTLLFRLGWLQIVKGDKYTQLAEEQQTKDKLISAKRGTIYDTNMNELAINTTCYSVWIRPASISTKNSSKEQMIKYISNQLSKILKQDASKIQQDMNQDQILIKIANNLDKDAAKQIRDLDLSGVELVEETKRYYPFEAFLSHTLGSITVDNSGLSGLELQYNDVLSGTDGRDINKTDVIGNQITYGKYKQYNVQNGNGLILTIDSVIQHYVEQSIESVREETNADKVMAILMNPKTGDILSMAQNPEFNPNNPKIPLVQSDKTSLENMSDAEKVTYWNKMWRNSLVSDVYEPGSTFKLLTTAAALEEGITTLNESFFCNGFSNVSGQTLKCWSYQNPHGKQTLTEAVGNSCNPVFITLAQRLGTDTFYQYLETFGITDKTNIDFPGEANAILKQKNNINSVELATMGYGQGIAVTPIQLITAVSAFGNEGKIMQPRLVKAVVNEKGQIIQNFAPKVIRQTISKETANEICKIMEFVVEKGGATTAKISGYKIGGKTGTAQKPNENGLPGYSNKTYSSFIGLAPIDNPQIAILVIVDNPKGVKYGSQTAAPGAKMILEKVLRYQELN